MVDIKLAELRPAGDSPRVRPGFALVFHVQRPAEYRWIFTGGAGAWFAVGARVELTPPPNARGIEWRNPEPSAAVSTR